MFVVHVDLGVEGEITNFLRLPAPRTQVNGMIRGPNRSYRLFSVMTSNAHDLPEAQTRSEAQTRPEPTGHDTAMTARVNPAFPALLLQTTRVGHRFGQRVLFRKMDLRFEGGSTTAVTGPNGSGKSTLVRILAGLLTPTKGTVDLLLDGNRIEDEHRPMQCGMVAPYLNVYEGFSPRENLQFLASVRGLGRRHPRIQEVLERVQMADRADDAVSTFSSGMIQRVRLACALLSDPPVLLLDEPTATLDLDGIATVRSIIDEAVSRGKVVIVATNEPEEAAACEYRVDIGDYR